MSPFKNENNKIYSPFDTFKAPVKKMSSFSLPKAHKELGKNMLLTGIETFSTVQSHSSLGEISPARINVNQLVRGTSPDKLSSFSPTRAISPGITRGTTPGFPSHSSGPKSPAD